MNRMLPFGILAALIVAAIVLAVSSPDSKPPVAAEADNAGGDGQGIAGMCAQGVEDCNDMGLGGDQGSGGPSVVGVCVEGVPDCVDTVVNGDGGVILCGEGATAAECVAEEPPIDPAVGPGVMTYEVEIVFDESVEQTNIDATGDIVRSVDADAEYVIQESFPPRGYAYVTTGDDEVCPVLTEQLMDVHGVGEVNCDEVVPQTGGGDPDEPVTSP